MQKLRLQESKRSPREDPNQGLSTKLAAYNRLINLAPDDPKGYEDLESIKSEWIGQLIRL